MRAAGATLTSNSHILTPNGATTERPRLPSAQHHYSHKPLNNRKSLRSEGSLYFSVCEAFVMSIDVRSVGLMHQEALRGHRFSDTL